MGDAPKTKKKSKGSSSHNITAMLAKILEWQAAHEKRMKKVRMKNRLLQRENKLLRSKNITRPSSPASTEESSSDLREVEKPEKYNDPSLNTRETPKDAPAWASHAKRMQEEIDQIKKPVKNQKLDEAMAEAKRSSFTRTVLDVPLPLRNVQRHKKIVVNNVTSQKIASSPTHRRVKESPLSSDAIFRQVLAEHAGLFNLCIVVLVAVNNRLIIETLMKYGLLIGSGFWFTSTSLRDWPLFMCCLSLPLFAVAAYMVENLAQNNLVSEPVVVSLHVLITTASFLYQFA